MAGPAIFPGTLEVVFATPADPQSSTPRRGMMSAGRGVTARYFMGRQRHRCIALVAACLSLLCVQTARGNSVPIVSVNVNNFGNEGHGDGMVGWTFTLLQPITVSQVGWYDDGGDGLSRSFQVGLWFGSTQLLGDPTAGILIPGGTQATLNGVYRVIDLPTPLSLQPGNYWLGGLDSATTPDVIKVVPVAFLENPSYLTVGADFAANGCFPSGFQHPRCVFTDFGGLELGPMLFTTVPEPGTALLFATGVVGLALRHRHARGASVG